MKKTLLILAFMTVIAVNAQNSGLGFNYQAVVRNANGVLLADTTINLRVSLYPGQEAATPTWVEIQTPRTDMSGSFAINVGSGNRDASSIVSNYTDVNFAAIYYWLKIEIQEGSAYREVSFSRLPSSPYAEVAHNAILFPPGMVSPFAGDSIPAGWLLCDGSAISRTEYADLYSAIGVCWGIGDGSTTFNLPDMRGMFLRGVAGESGNDPDAASRIVLNDNGGNTGNNVGSYQGDAIRNITGTFCTQQRFGAQTPPPTGAFSESQYVADTYKYQKYYDGVPQYTFDASLVVPVGNDNRPKNVYVNYIIKY